LFAQHYYGFSQALTCIGHLMQDNYLSLILITASAWLAAGILIMGWTLDKEIDREIRNN
jgi:hypothetical protein